MAFNVEKLTEVAKPRSDKAVELARFREENRSWLRKSQNIALSLHYYLRTEKISQAQLAERLCVSTVYMSKLLKGNENLTLKTICKIEEVIGMEIVSVSRPFKMKQTIAFSTSPAPFTESSVLKSENFRIPKNFTNGYIPVLSVSC